MEFAKMRIRTSLLLLSCLICFNSYAQNLFVTEYIAGGGGHSLSMITFDRGFFTAIQGTSHAITVMKTDSAGNVLWSNRIDYQTTGFFELPAIEQAADSGFFILLNRTHPGGQHSDPTIVKIDKDGNYLWTQRYLSLLSFRAYSIIRNNDNGFMVTGARTGDDFVMKCDAAGTITWVKEFMSPTGAGNYDITTHDYNRFVVAGKKGTNMTFFETDMTGNLYWHNAIAFGSAAVEISIKPILNGGFVIAGTLSYLAGNLGDAFLLKSDSSGVVQWLKIYSASIETHAYDVVELADSSLLIAGSNLGSTTVEGFALKTDKSGNLQFAKTEFLPYYEIYSSVYSFTPGTILIGGRRTGNYALIALTDTACSSLCSITPQTTQEYTPVYTDTLISFSPVNLPVTQDTLNAVFTNYTVTKNVICSFSSVDETALQNEIALFPNPVTDKLTFTTGTNEWSEIIIYNVASEELMQQEFTGSVEINVAGIAQGLYFYKVRNKNGAYATGKFVKE